MLLLQSFDKQAFRRNFLVHSWQQRGKKMCFGGELDLCLEKLGTNYCASQFSLCKDHILLTYS